MKLSQSTLVLAVFALLLPLPVRLYAAAVGNQYDELNRLIRVSYPDGAVIAYEYVPAGNRTRVATSLLITKTLRSSPWALVGVGG